MSQWAWGLVLLVVLASVGCQEDSTPTDDGCILGYDSGGIAVIRLKNGGKEYLRRSDSAHFWTFPVWEQGCSRLACVDLKQNAIMTLASPAAVAEKVFTIPRGCEVIRISFINKLICFILNDPKKPSTELIVLDIASKTARVVAEGHFDPGHRVELIMDNEVLVLEMVRSGSNWQRWATKINLDNGVARRLLELPKDGFFCVSQDGKSMFVGGGNNKLQTCDLVSLRLRDVSAKSLPGVGRGDECFLGNEEVLLCRELDAMASLGTYKLNINDGQSERVSKCMLSGMRYSPTCPK